MNIVAKRLQLNTQSGICSHRGVRVPKNFGGGLDFNRD